MLGYAGAFVAVWNRLFRPLLPWRWAAVLVALALGPLLAAVRSGMVYGPFDTNVPRLPWATRGGRRLPAREPAAQRHHPAARPLAGRGAAAAPEWPRAAAESVLGRRPAAPGQRRLRWRRLFRIPPLSAIAPRYFAYAGGFAVALLAALALERWVGHAATRDDARLVAALTARRRAPRLAGVAVALLTLIQLRNAYGGYVPIVPQAVAYPPVPLLERLKSEPGPFRVAGPRRAAAERRDRLPAHGPAHARLHGVRPLRGLARGHARRRPAPLPQAPAACSPPRSGS